MRRSIALQMRRGLAAAETQQIELQAQRAELATVPMRGRMRSEKQEHGVEQDERVAQIGIGHGR